MLISLVEVVVIYIYIYNVDEMVKYLPRWRIFISHGLNGFCNTGTLAGL